jgi:transposase
VVGFIEGEDRRERLLLPDCLGDYVAEDNLVRVMDVFVDELDLQTLGFAGPAATGRPGHSPATMLKLYLYGYLNRVHSSQRLEREAGRNVECMWLTGKLAPDFKTIADFRRHNGEAIRAVCRQFVRLCREIGLIAGGLVAVDGSRFEAVNTRDKNYTPGAIRLRMEQVDASIARYLAMLDTADRQETALKTMPLVLYAFFGEKFAEWGNVMAAAALMTLPALLLFLPLQRRMVAGLAAGAVKQ